MYPRQAAYCTIPGWQLFETMSELTAIEEVVTPYQNEHFRYLVQSATTEEKYLVDLLPGDYTGGCNCPQFSFRLSPKIATGARGPKFRCRHIRLAREFAFEKLLPLLAKELGQEEPEIQMGPVHSTVYAKARNVFLSKHRRCAVYPALEATEVHHSRSRQGLFLMDERFWIPVSRLGHNFIHDHPDKARALTWNGTPILCAKGDWNRQP